VPAAKQFPMNRFFRLTVSLLLPGIIVAGVWIYLTGGGEYFSGIAEFHWIRLPLLLLITTVCVWIRFVRWQYLLRRAEIRLSVRSSLSSYLASLIGIATPAYIGELTRCIFIAKKFGVPFRVTAWMWVLERLLDLAALAVLALVAAQSFKAREVFLIVALVAVVLIVVWRNAGKALGMTPASVPRFSRVTTWFVLWILSFAAWLPASFLFLFAVPDSAIDLPASIRIFTTSTLLGGITLLPAGVGATGSAAILQLNASGVSLEDSVVAVSLFRLATVGWSLMIGAMFFLREFRKIRAPKATDEFHFDHIADSYAGQFPEHVWDHLLERKNDLLVKVLDANMDRSGRGLDLGCGLGQQSSKLRSLGFNVTGLDLSRKLLTHARSNGVPVVSSSALSLPFLNGSFDFVYIVGAIHHFGGEKIQQDALREVQRVLKNGGYFIVHETNPRNPIFRFYMSYVFPLMKTIDEGTEHWIPTEFWQKLDGWKLIQVRYFTFLPNFLPKVLMKSFLPLQNRLETSSLRSYSVHYMATLQKDS
jgi:SAM-dependent methyltransferase